MIFVLFHGAFGSAEGNWFPALKSQLESLGQTVFVPQFPTDQEDKMEEGVNEPENQTLEKWLGAFEPIRQQLPLNEKLCFVGHSLGAIFVLRLIEKYHIQLDSAVFVGAFLDCLPEEVWPFTKIIPRFQKTDFDPEQMKKLIPVSYVLYSDTDPYVPNRQSIMFAKAIGGSVIPLREAGHMNMEVNLDEFSLILDLCLTRLDISYAEKYKFLKQKMGAFEFVQKSRGAGHISFDSEEAINFKLFRFQNVKESGYATLYTGLKKLQMAHSSYMEYAREAAKRMKTFERVVVLKNKKDLKDADTVEQIRADLNSGIKVYICLYESIKDQVPEPDFGIWDDRYIVINQFDKKSGKPTNTVISSNNKEIAKVKNWWKAVKDGSSPINSVEKDISLFLRKTQ